MNYKDAMTMAIEKAGLKKAAFARRLGITPQALNERLTQRGIKGMLLIEMANALNYKVVLLPDTAKMPKDAIEITTEEWEGRQG